MKLNENNKRVKELSPKVSDVNEVWTMAEPKDEIENKELLNREEKDDNK